MTEDQDLMAKIGQLAGQINRFKNGNGQTQSPHNEEIHTGPHVSRHTSYRGRPGWAPYGGRPYGRGRGRGRGATTHRHRTLVLNNPATPASQSATPSDGMAMDTDDTSRSATPNAWVTKHARHMQLINSAVYDKEAQKRVKALEETRQAKAQKKAQAEQAKVLQFAQGMARQFPTPQVSVPGGSSGEYQILLNDIPFRVSRGGGKLIRVSNDPNTANTTPKRVKVAGVTFVRSKNGNLHRLGAVTSKRAQSAVKKKDELCQRFTTTGTCYKGPSCPYIHDPNKVAICKDFLQGKCAAGSSCDLSHEPSPHRSPVCVHFLRGRCSNPECRYAHVRVTPGSPVCRAFATLGYCEKGETCEERHVHECPDYANTGVCKKKHCRLPHVDRAGQIRKNAPKDDVEGEKESDASSEEEEYDEIGSDDVDSDYLSAEGELVEGTETGEISQQKDFISF